MAEKAVLRIQISEEAEAVLEALSAAHKKPRAWVITEALKQFSQGERMEAAIKALEQKRSQMDILELSIRQWQAATVALVEARERLEAESLMAEYAVDDADDHQFPTE